MKPRELAAYAEICGRTLARGHARSGDAVTISAYLGSGDAIDRALADFAELYADQNELDYAALSARCQDRTRQSADRALAHTSSRIRLGPISARRREPATSNGVLGALATLATGPRVPFARRRAWSARLRADTPCVGGAKPQRPRRRRLGGTLAVSDIDSRTSATKYPRGHKARPVRPRGKTRVSPAQDAPLKS